MADDLGADLDQRLPQRGQRPVLHLLRQRRCLLWVNNGSPAWASECPELGEEQTSYSGGCMSVHSQKETQAAS